MVRILERAKQRNGEAMMAFPQAHGSAMSFIRKLQLPGLLALLSLLLLLSGCIHPRQTAHRATDIDPKQATAQFWLDKPAVASVDWHDFHHLWDAAGHVARKHRFQLDQNDPRQGAMTTFPLVSKEIIEVWRDDLPRFKDELRATLAEYRQIIRFDFTRLPDGTYRVTPRVVLERHSQHMHRVTIAARYQDVFTNNPVQAQDYSIDQPNVPADYWYATGRDYALERDLAKEMQHRLEH
ncbi:MAG TPA: hypothetical protein VGG19_11845 [Tepidisphaeraceae bacterium]|jgi:hypothetical protein